LLGAEAEQGGDVSDFIELRVVLDEEKFDIVADGARQNRFGGVDHAANLASTDRTKIHQVGVEVTAAGALDRLGVVGLADQKSLHFAGLE
jgi:hypothetical protein